MAYRAQYTAYWNEVRRIAGFHDSGVLSSEINESKYVDFGKKATETLILTAHLEAFREQNGIDDLPSDPSMIIEAIARDCLFADVMDIRRGA